LFLFDPAIRFAGITTLGGDIIAAQYGKGVMPLLSPDELQLSMKQALMKFAIRRTMEDKLGKAIYAITVYQKVKRATITIHDGQGKEDDMLLMISLEKEADHEAIITEKIIPFLATIGKMPATDHQT
jgi:hypothetical protein